MLLVPYMSRLSVRVGCLDTPDERKVHTCSTPRLGGVALFFPLLFTTIFFCDVNRQLKWLICGAIIIFLTGLVDDLVNLTPRQKFAGEFIAASLPVILGGICVTNLGNPFGLGVIELGPFAVPFTIFGIVGVVNAINLLDGLDGLAGGVCAIASVAFMAFAYLSGNSMLFSLSIALLGSVIGFLRFNDFPARIFMGDSGSLMLGYFMGCFSVMLASGGAQPVSPYIPLIILGVPILDTVTVMFNRKRSGRPLFRPDRTHLHHRLLGLGIEHKYTVLIMFGLTYVLVIGAICGQHASDAALLTFLALIYCATYGFLRWLKLSEKCASFFSVNSRTRFAALLKLLVITVLTLPLFLSFRNSERFSIVPAILLIMLLMLI